MNFNALNGKGKGNRPAKPREDLPTNIAMRLESIEIGTEGKPSFFKGYTVGDNEPVSVRMMTIEEGIPVNTRRIPGADGEESAPEAADTVRARLQSQYAGNGERHRPRPTEINNPQHKTHCEPGGLLMFTKCQPNPDGSYRAHWVETLERQAGAGCDKVTAHIRVEEMRKDGKPTGNMQVAADIINPDKAVVVTQENAMPTLMAAFADMDGDIRRKPFAIVRLVDPADGKIVLPPARVNAKYNKTEITDPDTGNTFEQFDAAPAHDTISHMFDPTNNPNQDVMVARAALFGLGKQPGYPQYEGVDQPEVITELNRITDMVRSGELKVEVIPGERISAGPATRASLTKAMQGNPRHPLHQYTQRNANGYATDRRFCDTFLTTRVGADGQRYFSKAVPVDLYPKMSSLKTLATANDFRADAELAQARVAEKTDPVVDVESTPEFDPQQLDGPSDEQINSQLARSAESLATHEV